MENNHNITYNNGVDDDIHFTDLQLKILSCIKEDFKSCSDIAWELKKHHLHIGKSIKSLLDKDLVHRSSIDYNNGSIKIMYMKS